MAAKTELLPLTQAEAEALCAEVRAAKQGRWFTAARGQGWGCMRFSARRRSAAWAAGRAGAAAR